MKRGSGVRGAMSVILSELSQACVRRLLCMYVGNQ